MLQVRKEKLGDRITALQQLVSPFGKVSDQGLNLVKWSCTYTHYNHVYYSGS